MTPLRFKTVQNHCVPWPLPASRCIAIASRPKANPLRAFAARLHASPSRFDSSQYHCQTMLCCSVRRHCNSLRFSAIPVLRNALPLRLRCITTPVSAFPLRCRDTHRPAKPSLFFWFQNRTQPAHAVLGRAALHLSIAMHGCSSHFLCCARLNQALPLLCFSTLCRSFAVLSIAGQC